MKDHPVPTLSSAAPTKPAAPRRKWRIPLIAVVLGGGALLIIGFLVAAKQIELIFTTLNTHDLLFVIAAGVISGVIVSVVLNRIQKDAWTDDVERLTGHVAVLSTQTNLLATELATLRKTYVDHLNELVKAIGGPFTKSLFAYPPLTSDRIAEIISEESDRLYQQHHQRVLVTTGKDTYLIDGLQSYGTSNVLVWSLRFHTTWTWYNDSKVPKRPLDDLTFVTAANDEAFASFTSAKGSGELEGQRKLRASFYEMRKNIIKTTAVNPLDISKRIGDDDVKTVFDIKHVTVTVRGQTEIFEGSRLPKIPGDPIYGIYSAQVLPPSEKVNTTLEPGEEMRIDYIGHLYRLAEEKDDGYVGWISFSPTDIVARKYELVLLYPPALQVDHRKVRLDIDRENSGSNYLHEALDNNPDVSVNADPDDIPPEFLGFRGSSAKINGPTPLTSLHRFTLVWNGVPSGPVQNLPYEPASRTHVR